MLSFKLLGNVELSRNGELLQGFRSQKELALLIYLAQTGQAQRRDLLAELFWDSGSTKQALSNLRTTLARLQKMLGDVLLVTPKTLALAPEHRQQVDSLGLIDSLRRLELIDSREQALALQHALTCYTGDFLGDFQLRNAPQFDEWLTATRETIRRDVLMAYQRLADYILSIEDNELGIAVARSWLQVDQLDEAAHALLIQLLIKQGNKREALVQYETYVSLLERELALGPSEEVSALLREIRPSQSAPTQRASAQPRLVATAPHNIPSAYDQFFGREAIQKQLHERLDQSWCRLVTIVGPGGVGKTRLATTVARSRLAHYHDGVWLVELADLDPDDEHLKESLAVEIATTLDLRFTGSAAPIEQLLNHLRHKQCLLVLDNFEHLLPAFQLVLDLLQQCEQVQLLVTSREPLRLQAEWVLGLAGLSFPTDDNDDSSSEAVELFAARRAQQQWEALSGEESSAMAAICRMVEGLPLAIELAAALTRYSSARAIAEQLRHGFASLSSPLRDTPQRHQSLQIVFEMSWRMLPSSLQSCLARLSVFRGGFSAQAARQIAYADYQQLALLVDKSLLSYHDASDRYSMHPVILASAAEKLDGSDPTHERHADYFLSLLEQHSHALQKGSPQDSISLLEPDIDNLRLAWQTGLELRQSAKLLAGLSSLSVYYQLRGLAQEGESVMQATFAAASAWQAEGWGLAIRAGLEQARFQNRLGRYWPATLSANSALALSKHHSDRWAEGMGQVLWAESLWRLGQYDLARSKLRQAQELGRAIGAQQIVAWCHHHLGVIDDIQGRYDGARTHLQQACQLWKSLENANALSGSLTSFGLVYLHLGELQAAQQAMEHALELCEQLDNRHLQALVINNLSLILGEQGSYTKAEYYLKLGLDLAITSGNLVEQAEIYTSLGKNYLKLNKLDTSEEYFEQGLQVAEIIGNRSLIALLKQNQALLKQEQDDLDGAERFYQQALQIAHQDSLSHLECDLLLDLAEFLFQRKQYQAKQYALEARGLAQTIGNPQLLIRAEAIAAKLAIPLEIYAKSRSA